MDIGEKIKQLRVKNGLTQQDLADRCELSKGFISQVENNMASPSIVTLMDMLETLGVSAKDFFDDNLNDRVVFGKEEVFVREDSDAGYTINWLIPSALKNEMEPILLTLAANGRSQQYAPFDGEVFGYVIRGSVNLNLGKQLFRINEGESFYHTARHEFWLENKTKEDTEILWVTTPPNF